jgi:antitoxin component of RelBE/YafQ-DinJ toxin-antitoxin module
MNNPSLLLTAPLLEGGNGPTAPPAPGVFSDSGVQQAFQTLQTDVKNDLSNAARPTHASVGALQDDLDAIRQGTLTGTAASTKIQADQAAILASMGLTQGQIAQIQSDQQALQTAITAASAATTGTTTSAAPTTTNSGTPPAPSSGVQSAFETLQTELKNDTTSGAAPSHAAIGTVQDDLDAIRKGTLTGTAAVSQVQTDATAVLTSMGLTAAQVSQVQADQQALASAIASDPNRPSMTSGSSASMDTLQSVSAYLVGLPGVSSFGMGGGSLRGFGPGGGGPRGGFMGWR